MCGNYVRYRVVSLCRDRAFDTTSRQSARRNEFVVTRCSFYGSFFAIFDLSLSLSVSLSVSVQIHCRARRIYFRQKRLLSSNAVVPRSILRDKNVHDSRVLHAQCDFIYRVRVVNRIDIIARARGWSAACRRLRSSRGVLIGGHIYNVRQCNVTAQVKVCAAASRRTSFGKCSNNTKYTYI